MATAPSAQNNLYDVLKRGWGEPERPFMTLSDGAVITYAQVETQTASYANAIRAQGVGIGDRVVVQVEKSPAALFVYLAAVRAGAVFVPLNTAYTLAELDYFIGDAEPALIVCDPARREAITAIASRNGNIAVETLDAAGKGSLQERASSAAESFETEQRGADDLAAVLYTSGTTGRSKGAMLTHGNLASNALVLATAWGFTRDDVLIHALPIFHVHGLFVATNVILAAGARMIFLPKFDPDEVFRNMDRATCLMGVPTFYVRLLADPRLTHATTRHMRLFVSGSAPLLAETHRSFSERTGHAILERYGMTETGMNTSNPYKGGERVPGAVGLPLAGVSIRISDPETGKELQQGDIGMIEVKGPNVFKGYWRMPEKTAGEFRADGYFITGDLGKIDDKGYVHIVGRGKDLVITGGYNVYPKEVEAEIDALPGVVESAVIGLPHADFGEGVTAVVVREKVDSIDERAILAALEGRLARFKQPKRVLFVDELPRNTMGKVQKNVLQATYKDLYRPLPKAG